MNTVYMAVQCTPDLLVDELMISCKSCLSTAIDFIFYFLFLQNQIFKNFQIGCIKI